MTPIKALLLDQAFAAGVGNWIADEVLYQARIDPRRRADELSPVETRRLRAKLKSVVEMAVRVDADKSRFPRGWLFHRRWKRDPTATTLRGDRIEHLTIGGRTTAWVPEPSTVTGDTGHARVSTCNSLKNIELRPEKILTCQAIANKLNEVRVP